MKPSLHTKVSELVMGWADTAPWEGFNTKRQ